MARTTVYLADRQVLFREGIHFTLSGEEDIEVVGETTSNEEALSFIQSSPPAIAILNVNHSKPSGLEITARIKQDVPAVAVILVFDCDDDERLYSSIKAGASACVTKDVDPDTLLQTIREVAAGSQPIRNALFNTTVAQRILEDFETLIAASGPMEGLLAHLTPREADILRHITEGKSRDDIAAAMGIDGEAINLHLTMIISKLAANEHGRELIAAAQRAMTSLLSQGRVPDKPAVEYITRDEFAAFQQNLKQRLGFQSA